MPEAASIQDWASSGVRKLDELGGASARRDVEEKALWGWMGANAFAVDARAMKMARLDEDVHMML